MALNGGGPPPIGGGPGGIGGVGIEKEYIEERVAFIVDPDKPTQFLPRISVSKTIDRVGRAKVDKTFRPFETEDIQRVLDFENVPDPPPDGPMMHGEGNLNSITFPSRHVTIRGGFIFFFDLKDVSGTGQSHYVTYHGPPIGVIPLEKVRVELPPGGRRVFREHAQTDARTGYELAILHNPDQGKEDTARPPAFIAAESLSSRDKWAAAIRARAGTDSPTKLRAAAFTGGADPSLLTKPTDIIKQKEIAAKKEAAAASADGSGKDKRSNTRKGKRSSGAVGKRDDKGDGEDAVIQEALQEFGKNNFSEKSWIDNYFETHTEMDAAARCRKMEQWQDAIKRGLKNAVLEQYEYFVEASGEMTKMGREVVDLKTLVETQLETVKEMKEIDFSNAIRDPADDNGSDAEDLFNDKRRQGRRKNNAAAAAAADQFGDDGSDLSSVSSYGEDNSGRKGRTADAPIQSQFRDPDSKEGAIEIPSFLDDAAEEILAFVKESRYSDATELWAKAKHEVTDLMHQHENPSDYFLTKKQFLQMQTLIERLDDLAEMISNRLVENLRRKNEALKQASKRERSDPMAQMVPSVSPCCLNDDSVPLRLLVKLGKTHEAAIAYSARRSLLLLESLHERPLAGTGNVDLVIYAAQLSQSFFSCLAGAIEGFLDLFLASNLAEKTSKEEHSLDESSINSLQNMRNLPAGALASIVLWCDSELSKFSAAFGGTRVLGNLALTPPPRDSPKKGPRVLGQESGTSKDRQNAIEVAAQCVGQAFQYASENLDAVGLPLTPRLAESLRKRLKGCETEVAKLLDEHWRPIVLEWEIAMDDEDVPLDERRAL